MKQPVQLDQFKFINALQVILATAIPISFARLVQVAGDFGSIAFLAQLGGRLYSYELIKDWFSYWRLCGN